MSAECFEQEQQTQLDLPLWMKKIKKSGVELLLDYAVIATKKNLLLMRKILRYLLDYLLFQQIQSVLILA